MDWRVSNVELVASKGDRLSNILLAGVWTFAAAVPALMLSKLELPVASIWLANIIAVVLILRTPACCKLAIHLGAGAGLLGAHLAAGTHAALAVPLTGANLIEIWVTSTLLLRRVGGFPSTPRQLRESLILSMSWGPLLSGVAGALTLYVALGVPFGAGILSWYGASAAAALIVLSATWAFTAIERDAPVALWKVALLWAGLLLTTAGVFWNSSYPFLFLPPILLVIFGLMGLPRQGVLAMLVVSAAAVIATYLGHGPITLVDHPGIAGRDSVLQIYLLSLGLFTVPAGLHYLAMQHAVEALRSSQADASAANRAKSNFVATMSDELRAPLEGIAGVVKFLQDTPLSASQLRYVARVEAGLQQLKHVIGDVLDLSRIEAGQLELERRPVHLAALAEACVAATSSQVTDDVRVRAVVDASLPPVVTVDGARLQQILMSLLNNAAKFTDVGDITLQLRPVSQREGWVEFLVRDTGCGIPEEDIAELLGRLGRAGDGRGPSGSGLGLTIARWIVELMGGELSITSQLGYGTIVSVQLALEPTEAQALPQLEEGPVLPPPTPIPLDMSALVVEDDAVMGELLAMHLMALGCQVTLCQDPFQAAQKITAGAFDVALTDLHMPGLDGFGLLRRARLSRPELPVLLMTADATSQTRQVALAAGFHEVLLKPIDREALYAALSARRASGPAHEGSPVEALIDEDTLTELNLVVGADELQRTLQSAIDHFEDLAQELRSPSVSNARLIAIAHQLRGTAGALALCGVQAQASLLEELAGSGEDVSVSVDVLVETLSATRDELVALGLCKAPPKAGERKIIQFRGKE